MNTDFKIITYDPKYEDALLALERKATQGSWIQLEMIRDRFLSRSVVFDNYKIFLGVTENAQLVGVTAGAIVPIECNNNLLKVGIGYDLKVFPEFRKLGLAKTFGSQLVYNYFLPSGSDDFFVTMKTKNIAVAKACYSINRKWYHYEFIYLTIPTWRRIKQKVNYMEPSSQLKFKTKLFPSEKDLTTYFSKTKSGLGIWNTHKMYQIKLRKLNPILKLGQALSNLFLPKHRHTPSEGDLLKFATLFDFDESNFYELNEVLEQLQEDGIQYLNVCCQKGDFVWQTLKPIAINAYPYSLVGTFKTTPTDEIAIDVRSL